MTLLNSYFDITQRMTCMILTEAIINVTSACEQIDSYRHMKKQDMEMKWKQKRVVSLVPGPSLFYTEEFAKLSLYWLNLILKER